LVVALVPISCVRDMSIEQLRRTAVILACVLLVVAFASTRMTSPYKPAVEDRPPVLDPVITYYQPEHRFEDLRTVPTLAARPIEVALAEVRPKSESASAELVPLVHQAMTDPPTTTGQSSAKKVERDPVCGTKGRRYFKLNGRQVWRCIR
jgi:hypothetical protein